VHEVLRKNSNLEKEKLAYIIGQRSPPCGDYCAYPAGTAPVSPDRCEDLNAEAADADVNAAYFMAETHNAANATAWMLGQDQLAWIAIRDQSCGVGPVGLPCRIRLARRRTRVLIGPRRN
jgi:uncharacterized protein YecT (DUF1311 family)